MAFSLSSRDRRALMLLGGALLVFALLQSDFLLPAGGGGSAATSASIDAVEERLLLAQVQARQTPLADAEFEAVSKTLATLEIGLLRAETAALAQAEMREIVGELLNAEGIPMRSSQFGAVRLEGDSYAQVPLIVSFSCGIEKLVNLMAGIANAPQLLSTRQIKVSAERGQTKTIRVEMTVSGYLPVSRTPELVKTSLSGARF